MINRVHVFNALLLTLGCMIFAVTGGYVWSVYLETPYLSYRGEPFKIKSEKIYPGSVAQAIAIRCSTSNENETYRSTRMLIRENSGQPPRVLLDIMVDIDPGCRPIATDANVVPDDTPPGYYRFAGKSRPQGLFVEHEVPWNTDVFEVLAKPVAPTETLPAPNDGTSP